jgi:putative RNA 2'-phosphotransferase
VSATSKIDLRDVSRATSHALRHEPWLYELELDDAGWVATEALLAALRGERRAWSSLTEADLAAMIEQSDKKRYELRVGHIRALYGHSTPQKLLKEPAEPPAMLYHGTSPDAAKSITADGLRPMSRQYVHLSTDTEMAMQVGRRKADAPIILIVHAGEAHAHGVAFYRGNDRVWLADMVPPAFIAGLDGS